MTVIFYMIITLFKKKKKKKKKKKYTIFYLYILVNIFLLKNNVNVSYFQQLVESTHKVSGSIT